MKKILDRSLTTVHALEINTDLANKVLLNVMDIKTLKKYADNQSKKAGS